MNIWYTRDDPPAEEDAAKRRVRVDYQHPDAPRAPVSGPKESGSDTDAAVGRGRRPSACAEA